MEARTVSEIALLEHRERQQQTAVELPVFGGST